MKAKLLVSSAASILLFGAIAVGGTYSLFTSEGGADIAATAGKVSVKASLELLKTYSGQWDAEAETPAYKHVETAALGAFSNGGSAKVDSGVITLDKMTPMDKAEFKIAIENGSDVAVKYRTRFSVPEDGGLAEGLRITVDGQEYDGMTTFSKWAEWTAQGEIEIPVSVELPEEAGNAYQGKSAKVQFVVEAVQANAHVEDVPEGEIWLYTPTDVVLFSNSFVGPNAKDFKGKVVLNNDIDMGGREMYAIGSLDADNVTTFQGEFDGQGNTISNALIKQRDDFGTGFFGSTTRYDGEKTVIKDLKLDNCVISGTKNVGGIVGQAYYTDIEGCEVTNCVIESKLETGKTYSRAAGISANSNTSGSIKNCKSENNAIAAYENGESTGPQDINTYHHADIVLENNASKDNTLIKMADAGLGHDESSNTFYLLGNEGFEALDKKINASSLTNADVTLDIVNDIDMENDPLGFDLVSYKGKVKTLTIDGNDKTISNLLVQTAGTNDPHGPIGAGGSNYYGTGFVQRVDGTQTLTIKDLTIDGADINDKGMAINADNHTSGVAAVVGINYGITNLNNVNVVNSKIDGGEKVAALIGYDANKSTITDCSVRNTEVTGYACFVAPAVGYCRVNNAPVFTNLVLENNKLGIDRTSPYNPYHEWHQDQTDGHWYIFDHEYDDFIIDYTTVAFGDNYTFDEEGNKITKTFNGKTLGVYGRDIPYTVDGNSYSSK